MFRVVAGEHDLSQVSGLEQNRDVINFQIHPDYKKKTSENDIALIYVKTNLAFHYRIKGHILIYSYFLIL